VSPELKPFHTNFQISKISTRDCCVDEFLTLVIEHKSKCETHVWDFKKMYDTSIDCQACIRIVVGADDECEHTGVGTVCGA